MAIVWQRKQHVTSSIQFVVSYLMRTMFRFGGWKKAEKVKDRSQAFVDSLRQKHEDVGSFICFICACSYVLGMVAGREYNVDRTEQGVERAIQQKEGGHQDSGGLQHTSVNCDKELLKKKSRG
eukprot:scaffold37386_cov17-Tisochrysis_lutea.AAC.2